MFFEHNPLVLVTVVYCNVGSVTKPMCHPFWIDMSHMCHALLGFFQAQYGQEMARHHGEDVNWRKEPIDSMVLYTSGGGKSHGR
jgi:hypothetical protein